jgi:hypothetical protein
MGVHAGAGGVRGDIAAIKQAKCPGKYKLYAADNIDRH